MATRFSCTQFSTLAGDKFSIYIDDSAYSGAITEFKIEGASLDIDYQGNTSTRYTPVLPSSASFQMFIENATHEAFITDLAAAAEGRFTVKITRGITGAEELYWVGYILADIARLEDLRYPFRLQVRATDGLGRLKGIDYRNGSVPYHFDTFITHLTRCLSEGELPALYFSTSDVFLRTSIEWIENGHGTLATSKCPMAFSRVDGDTWAKENPGQIFEFKSCYEVIESICAGWKAQILFSDGCYRIRQLNSMRNATFTERRFSRTGTLISSNASISYPKTINHTPDGTKISYPTVGFFPALKSVTVNYDHDTYKNYLDNAGSRWSNTGVNLPLTFNDVRFDSDSRIRLSGTLYLKLSSPANTPYRMVFFLDLLAGSNRWKSLTSVPVPTINNIIRDTPVWDPSIDKYHITTEFIYTNEWEGEVNFDIITDPVPSGASSFSVNFQENTSYTPDGLANLINVDQFEVRNLVLTIQGIDSQENYYAERKYKAINPVTGNSKTEEIDTIFGHAVKPWTPRRIQVSSDGTTWVDSTATWKTYGSSGSGYEFGELLARYTLAGQKKPTRIMEATFRGSVLDAHRRYGTLDGFFWAFVNGSINVVNGQINGEFIEVAYDDAADGETTDVPGPPSGIVKVPSVVPTRANVASNFEISSVVALATQATNFTPGPVSAGAITTLNLSNPAKGNSYLAGDDIFIFSPSTGEMERLTVTANNAVGATSLAVSGTLTKNYPKGSFILYDPLNKFTTAGGGPTTAPIGTVTSVALALPSIFTISGSPVTTSGTLTATFANQAAGLFLASPAASTGAPAMRAIATSDIANNLITLPKIQQISTARILGRNSAGTGNVEELTGAQVAAIIGAVTGSFLNTQIPYATGANTLTSNNAMRYDSAQGRFYFTTNNTSTDTALMNLLFDAQAGGYESLKAVGLVGGTHAWLLRNTQGTSNAHASMQVMTQGATGGDPMITWSVNGVISAVMGIDNSAAGDPIRLTPNASTPGGTPNTGLTFTQDLITRVGFNTDVPAYEAEGVGRHQWDFYMNRQATLSATAGPGAGTGATVSAVGGPNGGLVAITTGTSPTANGNIVTITFGGYNSPLPPYPVFFPASEQAAQFNNQVYWVSSSNTQITLRARGTLPASATLNFTFVLFGLAT